MTEWIVLAASVWIVLAASVLDYCHHITVSSMFYNADDTYNIPKVTDCTAALNEWVYPPNGDRTRLTSSQPRQLPELVRRFTQDVYMCVYIQPDVGMYGDEVYDDDKV